VSGAHRAGAGHELKAGLQVCDQPCPTTWKFFLPEAWQDPQGRSQPLQQFMWTGWVWHTLPPIMFSDSVECDRSPSFVLKRGWSGPAPTSAPSMKSCSGISCMGWNCPPGVSLVGQEFFFSCFSFSSFSLFSSSFFFVPPSLNPMFYTELLLTPPTYPHPFHHPTHLPPSHLCSLQPLSFLPSLVVVCGLSHCKRCLGGGHWSYRTTV